MAERIRGFLEALASFTPEGAAFVEGRREEQMEREAARQARERSERAFGAMSGFLTDEQRQIAQNLPPEQRLKTSLEFINEAREARAKRQEMMAEFLEGQLENPNLDPQTRQEFSGALARLMQGQPAQVSGETIASVQPEVDQGSTTEFERALPALVRSGDLTPEEARNLRLQRARRMASDSTRNVKAVIDEATGSERLGIFENGNLVGFVSGAVPRPTGTTLRARMSPDGTFEVVSGPSAEFSQKTKSNIEDKLIESQASLNRLREIQEAFDPDLLKAPARAAQFFGNKAEILGFEIPDNIQNIIERGSKFRRRAASNINRTVNALSGAAVTEGEAKRLKQELPDPQTDGPTQFQAKLSDAINTTQAAIIRHRALLQRGLLDSGAPISDVLASEFPLSDFMDKKKAKSDDELDRELNEILGL